MRTIARFMDARNTAEGKFLSVLLSVLLVFSFLNVTMFTDYAGADTNEASEENSLPVEEPEFTEPEATAEEPEAEKASEEVTTPAPAEEKQETAVEEEPAATDIEVELQLVDATIAYDGADYGDGDKLVAPLGKDLKFSVAAAEGAEVKVAATIGDEDVVLSPEADGNYILKGDQVTDALAVIGVVAEIPETDQAEEPADVPTVTPESPMQKVPANGSVIYAAADYTVKAGGKVQIYGGPEYLDGTSHKWSSSNINVCTVNGNGKTATATGKSQGTVTITHTYKYRKNGQTYTETFTVEVTAPTPVESISVNGASTVAEFNTTKLTAALSPAGSEAEIAWSSDDSSVATVDRNGRVTGVSAGTTTIRATITKADGSTVSAAHAITVTRSNSNKSAIFYYLKTPTSDPNSNDTNQWGASLGLGKIDVTGAVWANNKKNCYVSSQPNRVVEWPTSVPGGVVPEGTDTWNDIFNAYKVTVDGGNVTADDIESITLVPYKISDNDDGYHVDCQVVVKAKGLATARFYLWDAGATAYEYKGGETVREGRTVSVPGSVSSLPETTTAGGRTYRLVAWRTDRNLTGSDVAFPYTVTENVDFYAKYVADYIVTYNLDGGSWSANPRTLYAAGDMVTVASEQPQKVGYEFAGWKKSGESIVQPGGIFSMPEADVTLTAQWTPRTDLSYTVNYYLLKESSLGEPLLALEPAVDENGDPIKVWPSYVERDITCGTSVTARAVSVTGYKLANGVADTRELTIDRDTHVVKVYYVANDQNLVVNWVDETGTVLKNAESTPVKYDFKYDVSDQRSASLVGPDGKTYVYDSTEGDVTGIVKGDVKVTFTYALDEKGGTDPETGEPTQPDGVADKYQATVTYHVANGTFGQGGTPSVAEVITVAQKNQDGTVTPLGYTMNVPENMVPAEGYDQQPGAWGEPMPGTETLEGGKSYDYTFTYGINVYSVTVSVANGTSNVGEIGTTGIYGSDLAYTFASADGYALDSVTVDGQPAVLTNGGYTFSALNANHSINVVYAIDANRDGIPDSRQAIVNYNVANGTWADGTAATATEYVNMYAYRNGEWEPVEPVLNVPAGMVANTGYSQASGAWRVNPAASQLVAGGEVTFTYAFAAIPTVVVPPTTPVTPAAVTPAPTPAAPAAPAAPAPAAPAPAAAPAAATPAPAAEPIEDDATPQAAVPAERTPLAETEEIEDEATPMGAFDEPHCWVHWVMLLGILITAAYGLVVVRRRLHLADDVDDYEKQVLGIEDEATEAVPATGRQAL